MNIHINKKQHDYLSQLVVRTETIGSKLYGTNSDKSDTDLLCIYEMELNSLTNYLTRFPSIHQFQYKDIDANIDYIYCTEQQFFHNQASGDSTINSDILLFNGQDDTLLDMCATYKVIKGYLGFAKRDLKQYKEGKHKIIHARRGLYCAEKLLNYEQPSVSDIQHFYTIEYDVTELIQYEKDLRSQLTYKLNKNEIQYHYIPQIIDKDTDEYLFQILLNSNNIKEFKY